MIRIVTCLDFDTDSPAEAYRQLRLLLSGAEYETSDEWYSDDGQPLTEAEISAIRMAQLESERQPPSTAQ